jgi:hypothetical protein
MAPIIWAIVAILLPFPIVGCASGSIAVYRAHIALSDLPNGRRGNTARRNLRIAQVVGFVACTISVVLMFWLLATGRNRP